MWNDILNVTKCTLNISTVYVSKINRTVCFIFDATYDSLSRVLDSMFFWHVPPRYLKSKDPNMLIDTHTHTFKDICCKSGKSEDVRSAKSWFDFFPLIPSGSLLQNVDQRNILKRQKVPFWHPPDTNISSTTNCFSFSSSCSYRYKTRYKTLYK